jgi:hypothetical protein
VASPTPSPATGGVRFGANAPIAAEAAGTDPNRVAAAFRALKIDYGTTIDLPDLNKIFKTIGSSYGTVVNTIDFENLFRKTGV